jgi:hypothetical protein
MTMDPQFLEFWGNYLLMVAKGQRQMEDAAKWIRQGFSGFEDLTAMFGKLYGFDQKVKDPSPDPASWNKATADFSRSLKDWMSLMGSAPGQEFQTLKKKYDALKEKVAAQEETIRHLRNLLNKEGNPHAEAIMGFAELVEKQGREFQDLLMRMGEAFGSDQPNNQNGE